MPPVAVAATGVIVDTDAPVASRSGGGALLQGDVALLDCLLLALFMAVAPRPATVAALPMLAPAG